MNTAIEARQNGVSGLVATAGEGFTSEKIDLIKRTIAKGSSDDELQMFLYHCKRTGLDPLARQIYAIMRRNNKENRDVMSIQVSIDGLRLIADRTGKYVPGPEPTFSYDGANQLYSATAYVMRWAHDAWHTVAATALWDEYVQKYKDGNPSGLWADKPHVMLAKCFSEDTEVLTDKGFQRFSDVTGNVLQVTDKGLLPTGARPFVQDYDGEMVTLDSDDLNFSVTPNHDMLTTSGKVEAGDMFKGARTRPAHWIPRSVSGTSDGIAMGVEEIYLAAAYLADGADNGPKSFRVSVSRPHKVETLEDLDMHYSKGVQEAAGHQAVTATRTITSQSDKTEYRYSFDLIAPLCSPNKQINLDYMLLMSKGQARVFVDALVDFDGHVMANGVRRFYTSRLRHLEAFEVACVLAGLSVSPRYMRASDISTVPNFYVTVSERNEIPVIRWGRAYNNLNGSTKKRTGLELTKNESGKVWCVTVPSGVIVVRRNGFSMLCGNCAESLALRKAFPNEMSGLYTSEEMGNEPPVTVGGATVPPNVKAGQLLPHDPTTGEVIEGEARVLQDSPPSQAPPKPPKDPQRRANIDRFNTHAREIGADTELLRRFSKAMVGTDNPKEVTTLQFAELASSLELCKSVAEARDFLDKQPQVKLHIGQDLGEQEPDDIPF